MFEPKRLHPLTIIIGIGKNIKEIIVPAFIYFFIFFFKEPSDNFWLKSSPIIFVVVALTIMLTSNLIKWLRYTYRIEDNELRIEYGLFIKKKRYIPFDRIQSLDKSENILHRPFGLVKVKVETAGGKDEAEAEMTAIKKTDALAIEKIISEAKTGATPSGETANTEVVKSNEKILYKITRGQLLFFASTSGQAGVIISAIIAFGAQFEDFIPYDIIFKEMESIVKTGFLMVTILIFLAFAIAWFISVFWAYLKYNDFTLKLIDDDLVITRGLLEKRTTTIPVRRVQAVKMTESLFRQPFGYASVAVEYAGGSVTDETQTEGLILPVVRKKDVGKILEAALPDYSFELEFIGAPKRALRRFYFIKLIIAVAATVGLSIWLWPYGLFGLLIVVGAWILGKLQFRSAGWKVFEDQITMRFRLLNQVTYTIKKNRIQSLTVYSNWFQRRAKLATISATVMSGGIGGTAEVKHLREEDIQTMYEWYRPTRKQKVREE